MLVVAAFPGCGKSTFVKEHPEVADSDSSQFPKDAFPANYIAHIQERMTKDEMTLVSTHKVVRDALVANQIPFLLVYPDSSCKDEYIQRYLEREGFNGGKAFAKLLEDHWDEWIQECADQPACDKIIMQPGEFLTDVLEVIEKPST